MLKLELREPTGEALTASSHDFGTVLPGQTSPARELVLRNTGDADLPAPRAWIEQASVADGELRVSIGGLAVTGTSPETATILPALAVGADLPVSLTFSNPAGSEGVPVDTGVLRVEPL